MIAFGNFTSTYRKIGPKNQCAYTFPVVLLRYRSHIYKYHIYHSIFFIALSSRQPNDNIYGSFGIFCPSERIECVDLLEGETILIDWKLEMYLNFTHIAIMNRLDSFYQKYGVMERLSGDIYVISGPPKQIELER